MARKLRVEYPGAIYRLMNRGDRREPIFAGDAGRRRLLETPDEESFRLELLAWMSEGPGPKHYGEERAEREMAKAERIVREGLKRRRWRAADLRTRPKGDAEKVRLAAR